MPHVKSLYPLPPELQPLNFHSFVFDKLSGNVPDDFIVQIDAITGESRTYGQFVERVRDCATILGAPTEQGGLGIGLDRKVKNKNIIVIFSLNSLDYMVLVHASLAQAIPFCCLPPNATKGELVHLLKKVKAGLDDIQLHVFAHPSLLDLSEAGAKELGISTKSIHLLGGGGKNEQRFELSDLIDMVRIKRIQRLPVSSVEKDTLAYLVFSSGTSGLPKAVMISHANLCYSLMQSITARSVEAKYSPPPSELPTPIWLAFLPFYHSYGLHFSVLKSLVSPQTMVVLPKWNLDQALEAIQKYKINSLALVPSIMHQIAYSSKATQADLSSIVYTGSGAAYLSPDVAKRYQTLVGKEIAIAEGYGLSEATIGSISKPRFGQFDLPYEPSCTGILLPGHEARIVREDGSDADFNEPGELWLKGGNVAMGYWEDSNATKGTFLPNGWLRTGDRFRVDERGVFYYEDRAKDTLKVSGAQVAPSEIERVLLSHPEELAIDAAVAGVPSRSTRDEKLPRAWVVLGPRGIAAGEKAAARQLEAWVRVQLSRYKRLTGGIEVVSEIPKSLTGKVLRRELVDRYERKANKGDRKTKAKL